MVRKMMRMMMRMLKRSNELTHREAIFASRLMEPHASTVRTRSDGRLQLLSLSGATPSSSLWYMIHLHYLFITTTVIDKSQSHVAGRT